MNDEDKNIDEILKKIDNEEKQNNEEINIEIKKQSHSLFSNDKTKIKTKSNKKMDTLSKDELNKHLQTKLDKLGNRLTILQLKYNSYKSWYDKFNIMIIIISSLLSIFEAFYYSIIEIDGNEAMEIFFNMVPIGISSFITCNL